MDWVIPLHGGKDMKGNVGVAQESCFNSVLVCADMLPLSRLLGCTHTKLHSLLIHIVKPGEVVSTDPGRWFICLPMWVRQQNDSRVGFLILIESIELAAFVDHSGPRVVAGGAIGIAMWVALGWVALRVAMRLL